MQRERLGSRLGFLLLSAGCAIGIGNVWKFPYMTGQYGGGAFVLLYLIFLILMGIPVMTVEFSLGRAAQKSPVRLYQELEPKGTKWHIHGFLSMIGNYVLMMFYTSVAGWMIQYFVGTASGRFEGMTPDQVGEEFGAVCASPGGMVGYMAIVVVIGFFVCSFRLDKGLEQVNKFMMLALLAIMVILAIHSFTMDGAKEGLTFYLKPDLGKMREIGVGNVVVGAMNQAFFTLSLGIGSMAIFGSYIGKDRALMGESVTVTILDTFVAIVAGLIIFPACFTHGVEVGAGPGLIFVTLPNVFNSMPMGRLWGTLFFIFMTFAAMSTVFAVFENIISCCMDAFGWSRKKACGINVVLMFLLSLPCALGFNVLSGIQPLGAGTGFLDLEDFIVSNLMLPLGSICFVLFVTSKKGWNWTPFLKEANTGKGLKVPAWIRGYMTYVLPILFFLVFIIGLISYFK